MLTERDLLVLRVGQTLSRLRLIKDDDHTLNHTTNPLLDSTTSVYVWLYGLESHTSAAVAIFGCVIALIKFTIGSIIRVPHHSFINTVIRRSPARTSMDGS